MSSQPHYGHVEPEKDEEKHEKQQEEEYPKEPQQENTLATDQSSMPSDEGTQAYHRGASSAITTTTPTPANKQPLAPHPPHQPQQPPPLPLPAFKTKSNPDTNPLDDPVPSSHVNSPPPSVLRNNYTHNNNPDNNNNNNIIHVISPQQSGHYGAATATTGSSGDEVGSASRRSRRCNTLAGGGPSNSGAYYTSDAQNDEFNQTFRKHYIKEDDDDEEGEEGEEDEGARLRQEAAAAASEGGAAAGGAASAASASATGAAGNELEATTNGKPKHKKDKKDIPLYERYKAREIIIGHALFIPMSLVSFVFVVVSIGIPWFKKMQYNNTNDDMDVVKSFYPFKITGHYKSITTGAVLEPTSHYTSGDLCLPVKRRMKTLEGFLIAAAVFCFVTFILSIVNCILGGGKRLYAKTNQMGNINNLLFAKKHHANKARHNEKTMLEDNTPQNRHARPVYLATVYFSIFSFGAITCAISFAWNIYLQSFRNPYCGIDNVDVRLFPDMVLSSSAPKQWTPSPENAFGLLALAMSYRGPRSMSSFHSQYYEPSYGIGLTMTAWVLMGLGGIFAAFHLTTFADPPRRVERSAEAYIVCVFLVLLFSTLASPLPQFFYKNENTSSVLDVYLWRYQNHTVSWSRYVTPDPIYYNSSVFVRDLTCSSIQRYFRASASFSIISIGFSLFNMCYALCLWKFFATSRVPAIVLSCLCAVFLLINFSLTLKIYYGKFCDGEFHYHKKRFVLAVGFASNVTAFCLATAATVFSGLSHHLCRQYFPKDEAERRQRQQALEEEDKWKQMKSCAAPPPAAAAPPAPAAAPAPAAEKKKEEEEEKKEEEEKEVKEPAQVSPAPPKTIATSSGSNEDHTHTGGGAESGTKQQSSSNSQEDKEKEDKKSK